MNEELIKFVIDYHRMCATICETGSCSLCPLPNNTCINDNVTAKEAQEIIDVVREWTRHYKTNGERVMEALRELNVFADSDNKINNTYNPSITFGYKWWNEISNTEDDKE